MKEMALQVTGERMDYFIIVAGGNDSLYREKSNWIPMS